MTVGVHNVEQTDDVRVDHLLEEGNLADGGGGDAFVFGFETDLLQRDDALVGRGQVAGFVYDAVGACSRKGLSVRNWPPWMGWRRIA